MSAAGVQVILIMQLLVRHYDRRMMAPDEPGEQRNGYPDQRGADEEILEAGTLDDEARGDQKPPIPLPPPCATAQRAPRHLLRMLRRLATCLLRNVAECCGLAITMR